MNCEDILSCLEGAGYNAELAAEGSTLTLTFDVGERRITLAHEFPDDLLRPPVFRIVDGYDGKLAHVGVERDGALGEVCIGDPASTAVNTDRPELVYLETVHQHIETLTRLIQDPEYNRVEQLREFDAHWTILCREEQGKVNELFVLWDGQQVEELQVFRPRRAKSGSHLRDVPVALPSARQPEWVRRPADLVRRQVIGKALGVRLHSIEPPPPTRENLLDWYFSAIDRIDEAGTRRWQRWIRRKGRRDYWIVFSSPIPNGEITKFAIHWRSKSAGPLPQVEEQVETGRWTTTPYRVRSLSRESLVPRGGGVLNLETKSVLLVGCGSVGSELALRLTSAGIGRLTISDPDVFSEDNLYRHVLTLPDIGCFKTGALAGRIALKHPWTIVTPWSKRLEELRDSEVLQSFDLVMIAIGAPTVERVFAEYSHTKALTAPVINCWLEAYGIGGHATLSISGTRGCWHCAYVDPETLTRGLTSNLNFLKPGQVVMRNHRGCGTYLPYGGTAASYTATMAADLAVRCLLGDLVESSSISWKGSDAAARRASIEVTGRFRRFADSLQILPLHDANCDLCAG